MGLGNPTPEYAATKHNVGFMLADMLAAHFDATAWRERFNALTTEARLENEKLLLVKPLTFMNLSGSAVAPLMNFFKLPAQDLVVAHDDMDLPLGKIRLRAKGSSGGHRGVASIISALGSEGFSRVRIGVGRPPGGWSVNSHVLSPFAPQDAEIISETLQELVPAVECILREGIERAMNKFNPRRAHEKSNHSSDSQ